VIWARTRRNLPTTATRGGPPPAHNRSIAKTRRQLAQKEHGDEGKFVGSETIEEFWDSVEKPRRVIIMSRR